MTFARRIYAWWHSECVVTGAEAPPRASSRLSRIPTAAAAAAWRTSGACFRSGVSAGMRCNPIAEDDGGRSPNVREGLHATPRIHRRAS